MAFKFRLQTVLDYRQTQEEGAKQVFLERRAACIEAEGRIACMASKRVQMLKECVTDLNGHIALEAMLVRLDDEERFAVSSLQVLEDEQAAAEEIWKGRKRDLEAVLKLREKARAEWQSSEDRKEQAALDEWSVHRRAA